MGDPSSSATHSRKCSFRRGHQAKGRKRTQIVAGGTRGRSRTRHQNVLGFWRIRFLVARRFHERFKFAGRPNLFDPRKTRGLFRAVHVTGPRFGRRIAPRQEKYFRGLRPRHYHQRRPFLIQVREIKKIVLLPESVIDVVGVNARLGAEHYQNRAWSDRFGHVLAPRGQFIQTLCIIKHWCGRRDANHCRRRRVLAGQS